jgi:hypothetical protein
MIKVRVAGGFLGEEDGAALLKDYQSDINRYTYLE